VSALETASGGTLLIEHVDRLREEAQVVLLRALDTRKDVRFIATSNAPPEELGIRPDLAARLAGFRARIPPLRERLGDLGCLVAELAAQRELPPFEIDVGAARALLGYPWPGNVRELDRCLQVATTLARGHVLRLEHLPAEIRAAVASETEP
jgi:DNA-binding NtrC family response regulator